MWRMGNQWYVAPALKQFRRETDERWPNRGKASDGFKGDDAHAATVSQHNPNERGSVNAADTDKTGIDPYVLVNAAIKDKRTWYVIFDETIWNFKNNFKPEKYVGKNKHKQHVHISIKSGVVYENDASPWGISPVTSQELTVSDIATITAELAALRAETGALRKEVAYVSDQLYSIADNTYSAEAFKAQSARIEAVVAKVAAKFDVAS